ncbi:MAG: DUF4041 domain-containing protein [Candidatus Zapsychrus exili]|nr:DUF4041 domain-containing protein [Candidatus Zapsychrus exili]
MIVFALLWYERSRSYNDIYTKYQDIIDINSEIKKLNAKHQEMQDSYKTKKEEFTQQELQLKSKYREKMKHYDKLLLEISIVEENIEMKSFGAYEPHFDFDTSEEYKQEVIKVRNRQKKLIREKQAALCKIEWEVGGSKAEGNKMIIRNIKLILRAFNNECDSAILKVRWNNVLKMEERIKRAFDAINILGESNQIHITSSYLQLKLDELHLAHEQQEKLYDEKEEQKRIREQMREEVKVKRDIEKAQQDALAEEQRYENALGKAKAELAQAHGDKVLQLKAQMEKLQIKLQEAHELKERAISRAQLTKSGHVYVISNIGSFGSKILKIGMTRRLEPLDRVKELGDASVPFSFDVHAMIYSENAPKLESKLHKIFNRRRLNLINQRKEFFYATLDEIERIVKQNKGEIEFTKIAEAKEYRETLAIREKAKLQKQQQSPQKIPAAI